MEITSGDNIIRSCRVKVRNSELVRPVQRLHRLELLTGIPPAVLAPQDLTNQNPLPERVADYLVSENVDFLTLSELIVVDCRNVEVVCRNRMGCNLSGVVTDSPRLLGFQVHESESFHWR